MADDLDAFFDDVELVETHALGDDDNGDKKQDEPPSKKVKGEAVQRPRGVVVAAASSVVSKSSSLTQQPAIGGTPFEPATGQQRRIPPPPPPPPPPLGSKQVGPTILPPPGQESSSSTTTKPHVRTAAGKTWVDETLADWPDDDFRIFVGNMDPAVTDAQLYQHFAKYASLNQVRVIRDNKTGNSKGYGFVSLQNALECAAAIREQDQTWLGGRPIRIKRSHWKDRELKERKKKQHRQQKRKQRML